MKIKKDTILGKKLVLGDPNLVGRNEILVKESGNRVQLYLRNSHGKLVLVDNQKPTKLEDKDYIEADIVKVSLDPNLDNDFRIDITTLITNTSRSSKYFALFLPYYSRDWSNAYPNTNYTISLSLVTNSSYTINGYTHTEPINLYYKEYNFTFGLLLLYIIKGDDGEDSEDNFSAENHTRPEDHKTSYAILGLILVDYTYEQDISNVLLKIIPAFNKKDSTGKFYILKFKFPNIDLRIRTFYCMPLRRTNTTLDDYYERNRGLIWLPNYKDEIWIYNYSIQWGTDINNNKFVLRKALNKFTKITRVVSPLSHNYAYFSPSGEKRMYYWSY